MIAQTKSDKLDLAQSVLGIWEPYYECHFLEIEKRQGEVLRVGWYEVLDWDMVTSLVVAPVIVFLLNCQSSKSQQDCLFTSLLYFVKP